MPNPFAEIVPLSMMPPLIVLFEIVMPVLDAVMARA
jgi:hypothetical protein